MTTYAPLRPSPRLPNSSRALQSSCPSPRARSPHTLLPNQPPTLVPRRRSDRFFFLRSRTLGTRLVRVVSFIAARTIALIPADTFRGGKKGGGRRKYSGGPRAKRSREKERGRKVGPELDTLVTFLARLRAGEWGEEWSEGERGSWKRREGVVGEGDIARGVGTVAGSRRCEWK